MPKVKKSATPIPELPADQKQYRVTKKVKGEINHRKILADVGDLIMLNPFEAEVLKLYIKEE